MTAQRLLARRRILVGEEARAARRARVGAAVAVAEAERQAELPGEVGAQEIRQIGAVGRGGDGGLVLRIVLAQAEEVHQEVALRIAQRLVQRPEVDRRLRRRVEQDVDPGGEEVLVAAVPAVHRRPDDLADGGVGLGGVRRDLDRSAGERLVAAGPGHPVGAGVCGAPSSADRLPGTPGWRVHESGWRAPAGSIAVSSPPPSSSPTASSAIVAPAAGARGDHQSALSSLSAQADGAAAPHDAADAILGARLGVLPARRGTPASAAGSPQRASAVAVIAPRPPPSELQRCSPAARRSPRTARARGRRRARARRPPAPRARAPRAPRVYQRLRSAG